MKKILIFDTETLGLPISWNAAINDITNWPIVHQLAWELCWENGETIQKMCELIKPDGWEIPKAEFWINNGFNTETNEKYGVDMNVMLDFFIQDLNSADLLIAHNMGFDLPVITCEMFRHKMFPKAPTEKFCTKLASTPICKIPGFGDRYKWPTLEEAYVFFTGIKPPNAHQADADVDSCKEVYLSLRML